MERQMTPVKTTVGDLIVAISDAIEESESARSQVALLRQLVLTNLLSRAVRNDK